MDEQMIEQIARAIEQALHDMYEENGPAANPIWHSEALARAAHSVIAGKVAELESALRDLLFTVVDDDLPKSRVKAIELARAALAPYPERRDE